MQEIARVLKPGGTLFLTVPTDRFTDVLCVPRWLNTLSKGMGAAYARRLERRLTHFNLYSAAGWVDLCEQSGMHVETVREFFSPRAGRLWNIFALQAFRVCGGFKLLGAAPVNAVLTRWWQAVMRGVYAAESGEIRDGGYVFVIARK